MTTTNPPTTTSKITTLTKSYYDTPTTNIFYTTLWGGTDLHIGIYDSSTDSIATASQRTVDHLISRLPQPLTLTPQTRVLDLGAGYGGVARYLAGKYGCGVTCVNLSEVQNLRNRELCKEEGLEGLVRVVEGSFENVPLRGGGGGRAAEEEGERFDVVWSQDSFLHSGDRERVVGEIDRLLVEKGGWVVFSDIMRAEGADDSSLERVLERLPVTDLGSVGFYREQLERRGFAPVGEGGGFEDLTGHFVTHYSKVLEMLTGEEGRKVRDMGGKEWVQRTIEGTQAWIDAGERGNLEWGVFCFTRLQRANKSRW